MPKIKNVSGRERRRFTRVSYNGVARLLLGGKWHEFVRVKDLSLGGVFIEGQYQAEAGELCKLELPQNIRSSNLTLHLAARTVRVDKEGVALEFLPMEEKTSMFLQTMILYHSDEPYDIAVEFPES
ncbi:PilZ domain-containing protein [Desulfolithobacter sp.]